MPSPFLAAAPEPEVSLPGWIYRDREFFEVEMERVIRPSWQIVCHGNEIPAPGDWRTLDYLGESVLVVRGDDGAVRPSPTSAGTAALGWWPAARAARSG
jgi:hypothetical protein